MDKILSEEDEWRIYRLAIEERMTQTKLASIYNVSQPTISLIISKMRDKIRIIEMQAELRETQQKLLTTQTERDEVKETLENLPLVPIVHRARPMWGNK